MPGKVPSRVPGAKGSTKLLVGVIVVAFVASVSSVMFGLADEGQIDVSAAIANSNETRRTNTDTTDDAQIPVPKANPTNVPNGGLVGQGGTFQPPPQPVVEGTSTSSEGSASSTDESAEAESEDDTENAEEVTDETNAAGE